MTKANKLKLFPFLQWWPLVNKRTVKADLLAGLTGAIIVLPQGIAFSLIAGLPPIYGLYTAIVTPIVAALFGSSRHLVSGPTTTSSIAVFAAVSLFAEAQSQHYIALAFALTIMVGVIQLSLGLARLGALVNFISHSVVTGYTAGAAVLIATNQVEHVLGLQTPNGSSFNEMWSFVFNHVSDIDLFSFALGGATILLAILSKKLFPKLPHLLIAMILGTLVTLLLGAGAIHIPMVGELPRGLPSFNVPHFNYQIIKDLIPGAFAVAMLGSIEVVSISRSIAARSKQRLDSNQEFIGLGLSNIVGGFFSCYAGSGSFTRSAINYDSGAKTPMAAIIAAFILLFIILLFGPWAAYLPIPIMGGIILLVAYSLIDFQSIKGIFRASKSEIAVFTITSLSTIVIDLQFGILVGAFFSLIFYLMRTSKPKIVTMAPNIINGERKFMNAELHHLEQCPQLHIIRIDGSLFFGAVENIRSVLYELSETKKHILIIGSGINFIDASGAEMLVVEAERLKLLGGDLYFSHLKKPVRDFLSKNYVDQIGRSNFFYSKEEAISSIYEKLDASTCKTCTARIFNECNEIPK